MKIRNEHRVRVGKSGRPERRWKKNIKIYQKISTEWRVLDSSATRARSKCWALVNMSNLRVK
jgi:hypothetical protein